MNRLLSSLLTLSLLANAVLGWLAWPSSSPHVRDEAPATAPPPPKPAVFNWSQLEAPDFATYIVNLRRAGCPEATIRHLIEPELHAVFEARRQNADGHVSADEEAATLTALLGTSPPSQASASTPAETPPAPLNPSQAVSPSTAPLAASAFESLSVPAAFLVGDAAGDSVLRDDGLSITPTDTTLAPETRQTLSDMRRHFGDQVASIGSDPTSREFYLQWLKAQRASDDYFSALYGGDHFMRVQQQANLQRALDRAAAGAAK